MQHNDWLEIEEEELAAARSAPFQPSEENGLSPFASAIKRAVAIAGAALDIAPECESPIEATLGAHLKLLIEQWNSERAPGLELVPQYPLLRFRYDFGIVSDGRLIAAVECDGKEFHSSDEARANDAAKNVAVWRAGAEIFRFSGSSIFRRDAELVLGIKKFLISKFREAA